ncbi:DUF1684 domain-containing protein [Glycomyces harbinensis]|uniref:DUF1684 domain-containing protein n=1 Tax=Glycomyces harbinensis TaxID=58114 RepID=A0A1G6R611_9ACTN|nr:DUF1684 domain-containing protein [Glycomyces harbinensis]SDD00049.1 hypothetical protein SAMN05216270_101317 [Glycomyces harbinensis]
MTDDFAREWRDWHAEREAALLAPHGWLSLTAFHWLDAEPARLEGLPGLWSAAADTVRLTASAEDGLTTDGTPIDGATSLTVSAGPRWIDLGDRKIEIAARQGRLALRVRDPQAPTRTGFTGVPAFEPDPAWVLPATFTAYDAPEPVRVGAARPGLEHTLQAIGQVRFDLDGERRELVATGAGDGRLSLLFRDATNGRTTAAWRQLTTGAPGAPGADGTVALDFNRALNMPCVFTDHGTCPLPPGPNTVTAAVTAGERRPHPPG